jgi:hypothetical protein
MPARIPAQNKLMNSTKTRRAETTKMAVVPVIAAVVESLTH